jgi:hypothetical protein
MVAGHCVAHVIKLIRRIKMIAHVVLQIMVGVTVRVDSLIGCLASDKHDMAGDPSSSRNTSKHTSNNNSREPPESHGDLGSFFMARFHRPGRSTSTMCFT